eukprot:7375857-Prymnesium_polylepis.1
MPTTLAAESGWRGVDIVGRVMWSGDALGVISCAAQPAQGLRHSMVGIPVQRVRGQLQRRYFTVGHEPSDHDAR